MTGQVLELLVFHCFMLGLGVVELRVLLLDHLSEMLLEATSMIDVAAFIESEIIIFIFLLPVIVKDCSSSSKLSLARSNEGASSCLPVYLLDLLPPVLLVFQWLLTDCTGLPLHAEAFVPGLDQGLLGNEDLIQRTSEGFNQQEGLSALLLEDFLDELVKFFICNILVEPDHVVNEVLHLYVIQGVFNNEVDPWLHELGEGCFQGAVFSCV
mmetsp:Transcript_24615/g.38241  ORF Transcript_24615/g.38241 Transcript_24615/m.38241 type:complete len:211 (-) Transcript_24615:6018-6650(-)